MRSNDIGDAGDRVAARAIVLAIAYPSGGQGADELLELAGRDRTVLRAAIGSVRGPSGRDTVDLPTRRRAVDLLASALAEAAWSQRPPRPPHRVAVEVLRALHLPTWYLPGPTTSPATRTIPTGASGGTGRLNSVTTEDRVSPSHAQTLNHPLPPRWTSSDSSTTVAMAATQNHARLTSTAPNKSTAHGDSTSSASTVNRTPRRSACLHVGGAVAFSPHNDERSVTAPSPAQGACGARRSARGAVPAARRGVAEEPCRSCRCREDR